MTAETRPEFRSVREPALYVAFELGKKHWTLAITSGFGIAPWVRKVASGDWHAVMQTIAAMRTRFQVPANAVVRSCYEAGRDGFWIHRALMARGFVNCVVDSASIEVNRRARRAKTDRIDALKLVTMLVRTVACERDVWQELRVPTEAAEAGRQVSRERTALVKEQTRVHNQIDSWLATWGCVVSARQRQAAAWWTTVHDWQNAPLPATVQGRIARAEERRALIVRQLDALERAQQAAVHDAPAESPLARLVQLRGVATTGASVLLDEGLVWREFRNRREIGGLLGYTPTPYNSGESEHDQGISHAGNRRLQGVSIQLAWNWVRWQQQSALTQWYLARFGIGKRLRRIGIVALARKLLIALWRYATKGVVPAGAILKAVP